MSTHGAKGPDMAGILPTLQHPESDGLLAPLLERYGELMDAAALAALLKFPSDRAFRRVVAKGVLPVTVFRIPGRPGVHARTRDIAVWLATVGSIPLQAQEKPSCSDADRA
ncbi:hypothetical protein D3C71_1936760 [compost metagenome]